MATDSADDHGSGRDDDGDKQSAGDGLPDGATGPTWDIGRRAFLGGSGASAILASNSVEAQSTPPKFVKMGGIVQLDWSSQQSGSPWTIDQQWFVHSGGGPAITLRNSQTIRIQGRFAASNISSDFIIGLFLDAGRWELRIVYDGRNLPPMPLADWLNGIWLDIGAARLLTMPATASAVVLSGALKGQIRLPLALRLQSAGGRLPTFRFSDVGRKKLGQVEGTVGEVLIDPYAADGTLARPSPDDDVQQLLEASARRKVRVTLDNLGLIKPSDGWQLGTLYKSSLRAFPTLPKIMVEAIRTADGGSQIAASYCADGVAELKVGAPERPRALGVERFCYTEVSTGRHGLSGQLATTPSMVQSLRYVAAVTGRRTSFQADFCDRKSGHRRLVFPIALHTLHVRGEDQARYDVDFRAYVEGGRFLDRSHVIWDTSEADGVSAELIIGEPYSAAKPPEGNSLHIGAYTSFVDVSLHRPASSAIAVDQPILRARRAEDGLDLGFLFQGYRLVVTGEKAELRRGKVSQRGLRFHPQHLQEEVFKDAKSAVQVVVEGIRRGAARIMGYTLPPDAEAGLRALGDDAEYDTDRFTRLARTRVSGASRVIFAPESSEGTIPLSVLDLTDWAGLPLAVPHRMTLIVKPLHEQIEGIGIGLKTHRNEARNFVIASLVAPASNETSLELVTGLHFAPGQGARLRVPRVQSRRLWTAQLDLTALPKDKGTLDAPVSAVWSTGFKPASFFTEGCGVGGADGSNAPFRTSLSAQDRSEVMLQSSAVGIAALRAVTLTGIDVPSSRVRIPRKPGPSGPLPFDYVLPDTKPIPGTTDKVQQEGVAAPTAFSRFHARLTAFGADLDAEWKGEPIAPFNGKPVFFDHALSVEKYTHRTSLGSDVFVEVLYKGYLLPYGFRVSLIKVTEREPWFDPDLGAMMPAMQRFFIKPGPREKTFPGIYQPYMGMKLPARSAKLDFELSPELDPDAIDKPLPGFVIPPIVNPEPTGCIPPDWQKPPGRIFWPMFKGTTDEIMFDLVADGSGVRRSMPMLFIDNAVAHNASAMKAIHRYYNGAEVRLRTEQHYGHKTIYAAQSKAGDTSFETKHNILQLINRTASPPVEPEPSTGDADSDLPIYQIDAFMNGADELPVYAALDEALIRIPALDRLVGKPQGLRRVSYAQHYLDHGFDPAANPGELFLEFIEEDTLDLGEQSVAGGFAQMRSNYAGISRANAVVGAPRIKPVAKTGHALAPTKTSERWNFNDVVKDSFNPASFFKGATLLGVVKFEEVIRAATMAAQPKLREVYDYSIGNAGTLIKPITEACKTAAGAIDAALDNAERALIDFIRSEKIKGWDVLSGTDRPNIKSCYPDLTRGLEALSAALKATEGVDDLDKILAAAEGITEAWRGVKSAVDAVVANPAPEPLRGVVGKIRGLVDKLRGGLGADLQRAVDGLVDAFIAKHVDPLIADIVDQCFDPANGAVKDLALFDAYFGRLRPDRPAPPPPPAPPSPTVPPTATELKTLAKGLFANPEAIPALVLAAPAGETVIVPLLRVVGNLRRIKDKIEGAEAELVENLARAARSALETTLLAAASIHALVEAGKTAAQDICATATAPLAQLVQLAAEALPNDADVANAIKVVASRYPALDLPNLGPSNPVAAVRLAAADLRAAIDGAAEQIAEVLKLRSAFVQAIPIWCKEPGRLPSAVAELVNARAATLLAIAKCAVKAQRLAASLDALTKDEVEQARKALHEIRRELVFLAYRWTVAKLASEAANVKSELERRAELLDAKIKERFAEFAGDLRTEADALATDFADYPTDEFADGLDLLFAKLVDGASKLTQLERRWFAVATDFLAIPGTVTTILAGITDDLVKTVATPMIAVHRNVSGFAQEGLNSLDGLPDFVRMLTRTPYERLKTAKGLIDTDLIELEAVAKDSSKAGALIRRWRRATDMGLVMAARTVVDLFTAAARGQIGAIFSLDDVKRACEDAVRRFIPSRVTVNYDWTPELKGNSVFLPGKNAQETDAPEELEDGKRFAPLTITTKVDVDLLDPDKRSVRIEGKMQPFAVKLFGSMDLLTIGFTKTRFLSVNGGSPKFSTTIGDFRIGQKLEFLAALQSWLGGGKGFSITPTLDPPGITISYAFAQEVISFGALTILNLSFEVGATLPLTGKAATFRVAVGSSTQPFGLIIAPCYYGGGYISMVATGQNIVEFEIQLEFGAATAIRFGPLRGQGRVSTGIYFHSVKGGEDELSGFVHAIGEGQVACFGVSIAMAVIVRQSGSRMVGDAEFSFSFRVGFAEISYSVTAEYEFKGGAGTHAMLGLAEGQQPVPLPPPPPRCIISKRSDDDALNKMTDWIGYRSHFVEAWT